MSDLKNEEFTLGGEKLGFNLVDFWRFRYSNIYDIQGAIAEFIVAKALGLDTASNTEYWTLWDINYRGMRIEVKETSYYHTWNKDGKVSSARSFGITKANSRYAESATGKLEDGKENVFERQNDIYVFCLNTGNTKEESNPLNLDNWEFYVIPTKIINLKCGNNKTISLNKVKKITSQVKYCDLKNVIDRIIDNNIKVKYLGKSDPFGLINGKIYDVLAIEDEEWYRIIDETDEDYLYPVGAFEIVGK